MVMAEVMALPLSAVTGIVMLPEPSKPVAVPVAAPDRAMVRFAASLVAVAELPVQALAVVAVVAVAELPVQEPEEPEQFPVTFPVSAPLNVVAVTTFPVVMVTLLMESVPEADSIILDV